VWQCVKRPKLGNFLDLNELFFDRKRLENKRRDFGVKRFSERIYGIIFLWKQVEKIITKMLRG
jgi:hypothetical protein